MSIGFKGLVGGMFLLVGTGFFLIAAYRLVDANMIAWNGVRVTAEITGHERTGRRGWTAVYSFTTRKGQVAVGRTRTRLFGGDLNAASLHRTEVGRKIPVIYDPADPERSVADTFLGRCSALIVMIFVSLHIAIGVWLIRRDRRDPREDGWKLRRF